MSAPDRAAPQLSLRGVTVRFGGITALDDLSLDVAPSTICGLIGPNGAGKTTCFNCISGVYQPAAGTIAFDGNDLTGMARHAIAAAGIGRTFQNLALFPSMSVERNVLVGGHGRIRGGFIAHMARLPSALRSEQALRERVLALLRRFELGHVADTPVGELPFAVQKRVELARALAGQPKLLILDEPAAGLNHEAVEQLADNIRRIRDDDGITVLLVEHHMNLVMRISDQVVVLDFGRKIADGAPDAVRRNADVVQAYLGQTA
jgi:branched-chain amino acid transport system ATP-binding protein